jgi:hypothetical protein
MKRCGKCTKMALNWRILNKKIKTTSEESGLRIFDQITLQKKIPHLSYWGYNSIYTHHM